MKDQQQGARADPKAVEDATSDRYRLGSKDICFGASNDGVEFLPTQLRDLLERSDNLYRRIARLEESLFAAAERQVVGIKDHITRLERAFGGDGAA